MLAKAADRSVRPLPAHLHYAAFIARTFAQRAFCAAAIFFRPAADIVRFLGTVRALAAGRPLFTLAHRAFWAAAILALPAADILRRVPVGLPYAAPNAVSAAATPRISLVNRSCSFLNCWTTPARLAIEFPLAWIVSGGQSKSLAAIGGDRFRFAVHSMATRRCTIRKYSATRISRNPFTPNTTGAVNIGTSHPVNRFPMGMPPRNAQL